MSENEKRAADHELWTRLVVTLVASILFMAFALLSGGACTAQERRALTPIAVDFACTWVATASDDPEIGDVCATWRDVVHGAPEARPEIAALTDENEKRKALARAIVRVRLRRARELAAGGSETIVKAAPSADAAVSP